MENTSLVLIFSEIWIAVQSYVGECHQRKASGRGLPMVSEGRVGWRGMLIRILSLALEKCMLCILCPLLEFNYA